MIPGVKIQMGGINFDVPPLTLGQLRRLNPKIRALTQLNRDVSGITDEQIEAIGDIVAAALSRNYPDMTAERVLDQLIDTGNARDVILAVLTGSGLRQGEVQAVVGNGVMSMDSSPPPADTVTQ